MVGQADLVSRLNVLLKHFEAELSLDAEGPIAGTNAGGRLLDTHLPGAQVSERKLTSLREAQLIDSRPLSVLVRFVAIAPQDMKYTRSLFLCIGNQEGDS